MASVNFYNEAGTMVGVDQHIYLADFKGAPVPCLVKHLVGISFSWPTYLPVSKKVLTVTTDGHVSFQGGLRFMLVPHAPLTLLPPHPLEAAQLTSTIALSRSQAWMAVHKVTVRAGDAATCLVSAFSTNKNCAFALPLATSMTNAVINFNTVRTQPAPVDYIRSFVTRVVFDALLGMASSADEMTYDPQGFGLLDQFIKQIWRRVPVAERIMTNDPYGSPASDVRSAAAEKLQQWVDGEPRRATQEHP